VSDLDGWKHCPRCATALKPDDGRAECPSCRFVYYANSKPTASALIVDEEGRVLMSKRAAEPAAGKWDFPGGFLEEGEHPVDALHRELREEAGIELADLRFIGPFMDWYEAGGRSISTLNLYWSARIGKGTPEPDDDVEEFRFFPPGDLPSDELAFAHLPDVVSAWRRRDENA
jgi:ADP-ribose pyrophosphatase YjhB (NUDIX family)